MDLEQYEEDSEDIHGCYSIVAVLTDSNSYFHVSGWEFDCSPLKNTTHLVGKWDKDLLEVSDKYPDDYKSLEVVFANGLRRGLFLYDKYGVDEEGLVKDPNWKHEVYVYREKYVLYMLRHSENVPPNSPFYEHSPLVPMSHKKYRETSGANKMLLYYPVIDYADMVKGIADGTFSLSKEQLARIIGEDIEYLEYLESSEFDQLKEEVITIDKKKKAHQRIDVLTEVLAIVLKDRLDKGEIETVNEQLDEIKKMMGFE